MFVQRIHVALLACLLAATAAHAKKTNRSRQKTDDEDHTPQPSVVSYSTFGFNDVGSYDGFVPSSPGYSSYLSSINQEPNVRLYAPAFPSAPENSGPGGNLEPQPLESYTIGSDGSQASVIQYQNFANQQNQANNEHGSRIGTDVSYSSNGEDYNSPIYGTKIHSRNRNRLISQSNETEPTYYHSAPTSSHDERQINSYDSQPTQETKPSAYGDLSTKYQNMYNYAPTYPSSNIENYGPTEPISTSHLFPKVVDFTKMKPDYPTAIDNKYLSASIGPSSFKQFESFTNPQNSNNNNNENTEHLKFSALKSSFKSNPHSKNHINHIETETIKPVHEDVDESDNAYGRNQNVQNAFKNIKQTTLYKDQFKYKPWSANNNNNSGTNTPPKPRSPFKGYEYSTDHSNASFKLEYDPNRKKPFNINNEELQPASSNAIGASSYQFDDDFSSFKKLPSDTKNPFDDEFPETLKFTKNKANEYLEQFKNFYNPPSTSTSQWGSIFDSADFSYKQQPKKPQFSELNDEVVHIPKRQQGLRYNQDKFFERPSEWSSSSYRLHKSRPPYDWNKEVSSNRYKNEEDLLGLRTRDTSNSYLPTYKPTENSVLEDSDYKKLVDKWRQSYWKSKYKNSIYHDYEGYPSEAQASTMHVPVPKPYPIEIPHPVIVPVPQPFPVRVPVPKPVAVPVIQELMVPVERPVPYAVIKNVPFPVEKAVPYPVVKKVPVPVSKPYPVPVPHVRPVFHHSKNPREDEDRNVEEDDYAPRPEVKKVPYGKRPTKSARPTRSRRPSRTTYYERTRRRSPPNKPVGRPQTQPRPSYSKRPTTERRPPQRYHEYDNEEYERDSEFVAYCKRTGKC